MRHFSSTGKKSNTAFFIGDQGAPPAIFAIALGEKREIIPRTLHLGPELQLCDRAPAGPLISCQCLEGRESPQPLRKSLIPASACRGLRTRERKMQTFLIYFSCGATALMSFYIVKYRVISRANSRYSWFLGHCVIALPREPAELCSGAPVSLHHRYPCTPTLLSNGRRSRIQKWKRTSCRLHHSSASIAAQVRSARISNHYSSAADGNREHIRKYNNLNQIPTCRRVGSVCRT